MGAVLGVAVVPLLCGTAVRPPTPPPLGDVVVARMWEGRMWCGHGSDVVGEGVGVWAALSPPTSLLGRDSTLVWQAHCGLSDTGLLLPPHSILAGTAYCSEWRPVYTLQRTARCVCVCTLRWEGVGSHLFLPLVCFSRTVAGRCIARACAVLHRRGQGLRVSLCRAC